MKTCKYPAALLITALVAGAAIRTIEARVPYHGSFRGDVIRKVSSAKPKKKKLKALVHTVQTGDLYDAETTVTASGGGEKVTLVLDFRADDSLTVKINGQAFSGNLRPNKGRVARASAKFRYKGEMTGSAKFIGPLEQNLSASGKVNGAPTKLGGSIDLRGDVFILKLTLKSTSASRLGAKSTFQIKAKRD